MIVDLKDYKKVPTIERLLITINGNVFDTVTEQFLEIKDYEYKAVNVPGMNTMHIHRLLALTFIPFEGDPKNLMVNHKDGNKYNNQLDNLEWVTSSGNIVHAYQEGLRADNKPVLIKDLSTGKIVEHYSLNETARVFKVNGEVISRYINNRSNYPFKGRYDIIFKGQEWRELEEKDLGKTRPGQPIPIIGVTSKNGVVIVYVFDSCSTAAMKIGSSTATVSKYAFGDIKKELNGFTFYSMHGFNGSLENCIEVSNPPPKPITPIRKPTPIKVTDLTTGIVTEYVSVEAFGDVVGAKNNTIQKAVSINKGKWHNYCIEYCKSP